MAVLQKNPFALHCSLFHGLFCSLGLPLAERQRNDAILWQIELLAQGKELDNGVCPRGEHEQHRRGDLSLKKGSVDVKGGLLNVFGVHLVNYHVLHRGEQLVRLEDPDQDQLLK